LIELNQTIKKILLTVIKAAVLFGCVYWVYEKLYHSNQLSALQFKNALLEADKLFLFLAFLLFWINWGLEAFKWQKLIARTEQLSLSRSLSSVFAGVTLSAFIPFRAGSFLGRILFLKSKYKIRAIPAAVVGNALQLGTTLLFGTFALFVAGSRYKIADVNTWESKSVLFFSLIFLAVGLFLYKPLAKRLNTLVRSVFRRKRLRLFSLYKRKELSKVALISILRYFTFSLQYILILKAFGVGVDVELLVFAVFIIFLVQSFLPGFIFLEVGVRTAVPLFVLSGLWQNELNIVAASLFLYVLNILLAMCLGALAISVVKLKKW
jgi:hypothetical protein